MTLRELGRAIAWGWQNGGLVMRVLANPDVRNLLDALKELGEKSPAEAGSLHDTLVNAGVDTKKLAEEIHPVGPRPEGPGLGANV